MVRGILFISFFAVCFLGSSPAQAEYPFQVAPVNYYDAGDPLSGDAQNYLRSIMGERIQAIEQKFNEVVKTEEAIDEAKIQAGLAQRTKARIYGASGFVVGSAAGLGLLTSLSPFLPLTPPTEMILTALATSLGGLHGWSIGLVLASRSDNIPSRPYKLIIDGRGEEILKAAEDLSGQIRGMAAPRIFWSMRRLQDFTRRMVAFMALEHLLLRETNQISDDMKSALHELRLDRLFVNDNHSETAEVEIDLLRTRIIRRFRELEHQTLKSVTQIYDDEVKIPFQKLDYSKLSEQQCIAVLKWILSDPYTNDRDLSDLTDQL